MSSQPINSISNGLEGAADGETPAANLPRPVGIRATVFAALFDTNRPGNYQERFDSFTATLIVANLLALMLEHVPSIHDAYEGLFQVFDLFSLVVFSIEYVLRLYTAPEMPEFKGKGLTRLRWATQPMSSIRLQGRASILASRTWLDWRRRSSMLPGSGLMSGHRQHWHLMSRRVASTRWRWELSPTD